MTQPASQPRERHFDPEDPALRPGWRLLKFLQSVGADEFAMSFLYAGQEAKGECDRLVSTLAFASVGERVRECTVTYAGESNPRAVNVWRLDAQSLRVLRDVMPCGILGCPIAVGSPAWAEDLCVYRRGHLLFGVVSHEQYAFARLQDVEWERWEAYGHTAGE